MEKLMKTRSTQKEVYVMKYANKHSFGVALCTMFLGFLMQGNPASAAALNLSERPLFLGQTVEPNIFMTVDDSGSMDWEVLLSQSALASGEHGGTFNSGNLNFAPEYHGDMIRLCAGFNTLAYNPNNVYIPWSGFDTNGATYADQTLASARIEPFKTASTSLTNHYYMVWNDANGDKAFQLGECPVSTVPHFGVDTLTECRNLGTGICVAAADLNATQQTNYANWYSFYRKREYVAKAAFGSVIVDAAESRMGLLTLNRNNSVHMPVRSMNVDPATGNKRALLDKLYKINSSGGTPLQNAMYRAGEYLSGGDASWIAAGSSELFPDPRLSLADGGACQQNFSIVMTDGYYNGTFNFAPGNTDIDGAGPWDGGLYADNSGNTLADIAMRYYEDDLNAGAPKSVPTNSADLNSDQHLVTYTVAFGVNGTLLCSPGDTTDADGNACPAFPGWPAPNTNARRIDDLRHAAYNGRGLFLSAENPQSLITSINSALGNIVSRTSSSSGVAFNSTNIQSNTLVFQGRYKTSDWSGNLRFLPLGSTSGVGVAIANTDSILNLTDTDTRSIITRNATTGLGVAFRWASLAAAQQTALVNQDKFNYLRGDRSCETNTAETCLSGNKVLRNRSTVLGDIIHSAATFVGAPNQLYDFDNYSAYAVANANRRPVVYVGSNDGMLHGFDASINTNGSAIAGTTGNELIAYVPSILYSKLPDLSDTSYTHQYFVDGSPVTGDTYYGGAWHTSLVGSLGGGGQGIFALDVTNPVTFDEPNAAALLLWEFDDRDDADMGYSYSEPVIAKLASGNFVAIFGNGYNSTFADGIVGSGKAVLFIVDIKTGTVLKKISTPIGSVLDPNGLASPTTLDADGDFITDYVYAGDLKGNMWRFDLTSNLPADWKVSFNGAPLLSAISVEGPNQVVTTQPTVVPRSGDLGYMVYFGTGKYLELTDNSSIGQDTQTFYGIWDKWKKSTGDASFAAFNRTNLLQQTIIEETLSGGVDLRITSDNSADWTIHMGWYIDLVNTSTGDNQGERIVTTPVISNGTVYFSTLIPVSAVCQSGGTGWLMALDAIEGRRLTGTPFDINGDGVLNKLDRVASSQGYVAVSGAKSQAGIISKPAIIQSQDRLSQYIVVSNSGGSIGLGSDVLVPPPPPPGSPGSGVISTVNGSGSRASISGSIGRVQWQQIK